MLQIYKPAYTLRLSPEKLMLIILALVFPAVFLPGLAKAQQPPRQEIDISQFIQNLFPTPGEDANYEDLYESLFQLYANPLDLNTVSADELSATFILTDVQVRSLLTYRSKLGPFLSLYELQAIPDFDLPTIYRLLPFVSVEPRLLSIRENLKNPTQHFLMLRSGKLLEQQKGFSVIDTSSRSSSRYKGKPLYGYLRYRNARTGAYSFGISLEKDAGEKWWEWKPGRQIFGIDFSSFHAQLMNRKKWKNVIVGDYQMQAGQGLVMAAGFSLGKGAEVIRTTYRSTLGLRPYTSVLEANFFRGAAATYAFSKQIELTGFYSAAKRDASLDGVSENPDEQIISSLLISGYHRTSTERDKHNIIPERNIGFHALYKLPSLRGQAGLTMLRTTYGSYLRKKDIPYNRFEFSGRRNLTIGLHGDYRWQNIHFFGEGARSQSGGFGGIGGLIAGLGKTFDFTLLLRHYDRDFHTFYGNAISEATKPINETGSYWGLRYSPNRRWQFSGFYDHFRFPWLKYQINAPSDGHDFYLHILYKPNKRFNAYALFHEKHKPHNLPAAHMPMPPVVSSVRRTVMINMEYDRPLRFSVRTRIQAGDFAYREGSRSKGFAVMQDLTWHFPKLEFSVRVAFFDTDNYDSRQYAYEKDMLYAFSLPAYYEKGTRHYLMLRYSVFRQLKVWLRWSQTRYYDLEAISSGLNEISGNKRSELKAQMMYQF
jgi:hypothetical protein